MHFEIEWLYFNVGFFPEWSMHTLAVFAVSACMIA